MQILSSDLAIPTGSLVLVTGASGFIASHIVDQLLLAGYNVRGTVRDEKKAKWTTELFSERYGIDKYSAIIVSEMSVHGAFDEAVKGIHGIIHTASDVTFSPDPNAVIPRTVAGITSLLASASKQSSVRTFVYTSSSMACVGGHQSPNNAFNIDASTWNDAQIKEAWSIISEPFPQTHAVPVYGASKAAAEQAFWKFVKDERPQFKVNTILPDANIGEILSLKGSLSTARWIRSLYVNDVDFIQGLPQQWYVNVKDTARLHVAALICNSVVNERIFAFAEPFTWNDVLASLRKLYPSKKFVDDFADMERTKMGVPTERGAQILKDVFGRQGWTSLEESVADNVKDMD